MLDYIKKNKIKPEQISYNDTGVLIGGRIFLSDNPRLDFARVLQLFAKEVTMTLREGSWIADNTEYYHARVQIGMNCSIGGIGMGYEHDERGNLITMPHLGIVRIEDDVTIHNNVNIDRAVLGETVIGKGTKIDAHVHVAHGAKIGKNCIIISLANIGGSCEIGDHTWVGMSACIKQKIKIGKNCVIGMGAVVTKDIPDNEVWVGNPARFMKKTEKRKWL